MTTYAELSAEIALDAAGCPTLVLERLMQGAAMEFCRASRIYQLRGSLTTVPGTATYDLTAQLPAETKIAKPMWVKADSGANQYRLGATNPRNGMDGTASKISEFYVEFNEITFFGTPAVAQDVEFLLAIAPLSNATGIADNIAEDWGKAIQYLTLAHAFSLFDKSWSDHTLAGHYSSLYAAELQLARRKSTHNHMPRRRNVRFSW